MHKHREHHFDNSHTGAFVVTLECFHAALACVSDYHEKTLYLIQGPISGVHLILECDLYGISRIMQGMSPAFEQTLITHAQGLSVFLAIISLIMQVMPPFEQILIRHTQGLFVCNI